MSARTDVSRVLIADDDSSDGLLLVHALKKTTQLRLVHQATHGREVIDYLEGKPPFNDRELFPLPQLLLLDLRMPGIDGFGVLEWLQAHPVAKLVVSVITGSDNPKHEIRAYDLGAHAFFKKQSAPEKTRDMIIDLEKLIALMLESGEN